MKQRVNTTVLIYCLVCLWFLSPNFIASGYSKKSGDDEILVIGSNPIKANNLALAKEKALSQALRKGIEDYLVRRLGHNNMVNNFQRVVNDIIPSSREEIENFHILAEDQSGDQYKILVKVRINKKVIDEKLRRAGLVIMQGPAIKVLFLITEKDEGKTSYWWKDPEFPTAMSSIELALYDTFQGKGFSPINRILSTPQTEFSKDLRSPDLTNDAILKWGKLFSADVVIQGKAEIIKNEEISLILKVLDANKDVLICQGMRIEPIQKDSQGNSLTTKAVENLVNTLAFKFTPAIINATGSGAENIRILAVTLTDLKSIRQFVAFKDFLVKNVTGVKSVKQTSVKKDSISVEVYFKGDENRFLENVLNNESLPFLLDHRVTNDGTIIIEVK